MNGVRIYPPVEQPLRPRDIVQFGKVALIIEPDAPSSGEPALSSSETPASFTPSNQNIVAAAVSSFDDGIRRLAFGRDQMPR